VRITLQQPTAEHAAEFLAAVQRSRSLHEPWIFAPRTQLQYRAYIERLAGDQHVGYFLMTDRGELAGVINLNEITLGALKSAYLGYYAMSPHNGRGYMTDGLRRVITRAFRVHRLHRLEANVQPDNTPSRRLVQRAGFRLEGFSPRYLKIGGRWRDHERWAITVEEWRARG
jgi:ribosomal-protein-alanine N-acetyltransferase